MINETEIFNDYPSAKTILDTMDRIGQSLDYFTERINRVKIVSIANEVSQNNVRVKVSKENERLDDELSRKFERLGYDIDDIETIKKMRLQALYSEFKAMKKEDIVMSDWHSLVKKPRKLDLLDLDQEQIKKKALEQMKERDQNFRQNWQNWHDEHSEE